MSPPTIALGPPGLGLHVEPQPLVNGEVLGWRVRADAHLCGPPRYLQGGLCAGLLLGVARHGDAARAPATSVTVRLHAPTPVDTRLGVVVHRTDAGVYDVELLHDQATLVTGTVELAGHSLVAPPADLASLKDVPPPDPVATHAFPGCWVCGDANERGLHLLPAWSSPGRIVVGWIADEAFDTGRGVVDPVVLCAVLDCPTGFANQHHLDALGLPVSLLASYHVTFRVDLAVGTAVRCVAISDDADGRKLRSRSAIVDADGVVYATADATWIAVASLPG